MYGPVAVHFLPSRFATPISSSRRSAMYALWPALLRPTPGSLSWIASAMADEVQGSMDKANLLHCPRDNGLS